MFESIGVVLRLNFVNVELCCKNDEYQKQTDYSDGPEGPGDTGDPGIDIGVEEGEYISQGAVPKVEQGSAYQNTRIIKAGYDKDI